MTHPTITPANLPADIPHIAALFTEYATWLADDHGISLEFQGFADEVANLPGKYAAPKGAVLLARIGDADPCAVIAIRPFDAATCEIKRLYVRPDARGHALGKRLIVDILNTAKTIGYTRAILDTGPFMQAAQNLYLGLGFTDIPKYYDNPFEGIRYMAMDLPQP